MKTPSKEGGSVHQDLLKTFPWVGLFAAAAVVAIATGSSWTLLGQERLENVVMVYLLGIVIVSMRYGYIPSLVAAALSVLCFDFFFIPSYFTFAVAEVGHLVTFGVMFLVGVVISGLTKRARDQAERARMLAEEAHRAQFQYESEQLRNAILSSISHDLRTPLAVITGAATTLQDDGIDSTDRRELVDTIVQEADRLNQLVQNVLDMTRLEAGALRVRRQWHLLEEIVGSALSRVEKALAEREVVTSLPRELGLVPLDSVLIEQVIVNLLENAVKYTPPRSPVSIAGRLRDGEVEIEVADRGPGIPQAEMTRIFDKFIRARHDKGGAGLGLTICRGIVVAHGGRIWVEQREGGGASFRFTLPIIGEAPQLAAEDGEDPSEIRADSA
jgi:two-component system, OmpR family, sensor histidine kinase KdpD